MDWVGLGWVGLGSVGLEIGLGWGIGSDFIGLEALKRLEIGMPCTVRYPWHPAACGTQFSCIIGSVGQYATWYPSRQYFSFANSEKPCFAAAAAAGSCFGAFAGAGFAAACLFLAFLLAAGAGGAHRPMGYSPEVESPKPPRALTYHGLLTCGGKPVPG